MKLLAIDTSAKAASCAVVENGILLGEGFTNVKTTHSQTILPLCESVLQTTGSALSEIDAFAVSAGPGSFTGLRIGISAIKGFAFAEQKPCVAISTLDAIAKGGQAFRGVLCAVMDARCKQVYNALYDSDGTQLTKRTEDRALLLTELLAELQTIDAPILLIGDGAKLCYQTYQSELPNLVLAPEGICQQRASSVALLAEEELRRGNVVSAGELLPTYLRLPQAQRERLSRGESITV